MARASKKPAPADSFETTPSEKDDLFGAPAEDDDPDDDNLFGALDEDVDNLGGKFKVPDGLYAAKIVDGEAYAASKSSGEPGVKWTFVLTGEWCGEDGKEPLEACPHTVDIETEWNLYTSFSAAAQFQIPRFVKTFEPLAREVQTKKGKRAYATRDDMLNARFLVWMKQQEFDDEVSSKPGKIKRHPDGPKD